MDKSLFFRIVLNLGHSDLDDFIYENGDRKYIFKNVGDDNWQDEGKYQYRQEDGRLIEVDDNYNEIKQFNFGVSRTVQRTGSYYSDYYYEPEPYEAYEIKGIESKWNVLEIPKENNESI